MWNTIKWYIKYFLEFLGCTPTYQLKILTDPVEVEEGWEYKAKLLSKTYRLFYVTIYIKYYGTG